jgi:hypothetical protein
MYRARRSLSGISLIGYAKTVRIGEVAVAELVDAVRSHAVSSGLMGTAIVLSLAAVVARLVASS